MRELRTIILADNCDQRTRLKAVEHVTELLCKHVQFTGREQSVQRVYIGQKCSLVAGAACLTPYAYVQKFESVPTG